MFTRALKVSAAAAVVVLATAGASMAAQWAWADQDSKVRYNHNTSSPTVNWIEEGQKVRVIASWGSWYKIKIPGDDGWVKKSVLDFHPSYDDDYNPGHPHVGGSFCVGGDNASFCLGTNY